MQPSDLQAIPYILRNDPAVVAGLLLIGLAGFLLFHLQYKMEKAGLPTSYFSSEKWSVPFQYLKVRREYGWSPWPAYLIGPSLILGIASLIFGFAHF